MPGLFRQLQGTGLLDEIMDRETLSNPRDLSFAIAALEGFSHDERQRFLEMTSTAERLNKSIEALAASPSALG